MQIKDDLVVQGLGKEHNTRLDKTLERLRDLWYHAAKRDKVR